MTNIQIKTERIKTERKKRERKKNRDKKKANESHARTQEDKFYLDVSIINNSLKNILCLHF